MKTWMSVQALGAGLYSGVLTKVKGMKSGDCPLQQWQCMKQGNVSLVAALRVQPDIKFRGAETLRHEPTPNFWFNEYVFIMMRSREGACHPRLNY